MHFCNGCNRRGYVLQAVGTRSIRISHTIIMSVVCSFVGFGISTAVADTILGMDWYLVTMRLLLLLPQGTWAVGAWALGIPTSESHAHIASLEPALAIHGDTPVAVSWGEWVGF